MENLTLKIGSLIEDYDIGQLTQDKLQNLQEAVQQAVNAYHADEITLNQLGVSMVDDALYDRAMEIIRELAPNSKLATEIWEADYGQEGDLDSDFEDIRNEHPMKSIVTIKSKTSADLQNFIDLAPSRFNALCSLKENGWGIELFYRYGKFVKAISRGRSTNGMDLTQVLTEVLRKYDALFLESVSTSEVCSVRGELILKNAQLENARKYNPKIVSPLSAINSLRGSKMPKSAWGILSFRAYRYIEHDFDFGSKRDEYEYLQKLGFKVPLFFYIEDITKDEIVEVVTEMAVEAMERKNPNDEYYADGVVIQVDDANQYASMGGNNHHDYGALAIKMGSWEQNYYTGVVQCVLWSKGTSKLTPVVLVGVEPNTVKFKVENQIYDGYLDLVANCSSFDSISSKLEKYIINMDDLGVPTAGGNRVRNVPIYNIYAMTQLNVKVNGTIGFNYGAEAGVVPCDAYGNLYQGVGVDVNSVLGI